MTVEEPALLAIVMENPLLPNERKRLSTLRNKNRKGTLTSAEHAELLDFVREVESQDLVRIEALIQLARKRDMTVSALMEALGLEPAYA